jgi:diguanylate cyclase (GGDEF)-like protein
MNKEKAKRSRTVSLTQWVGSRYSPIRQVLAQMDVKSGGALSLISLIALALIDLYSGNEVSFSVFYLIPVTLAAWYCGLLPGILMALTATVLLETLNGYEGLRYSAQWIVLWNPAARFIFYALMAYLLVQLRQSRELLRQLASTDPLTGLANRRAMTRQLDGEIARQERSGNPLTLVFIDLDHFKALNDQQSHAAGDQALRTVASILRAGMRKADLAARLGGDEFGLILPETNAAQASPFVNRLHEALMRDMQQRGWPITFSIGAVHGVSAMSSDAWINAADKLMYDVKRSGGNALALGEVPSQT